MTRGTVLAKAIADETTLLDGRPVESAGQYSFARHVCICKVRDSLVLLDLRHSKYFGLRSKEAEILCRLTNVGWSHPQIDPASSRTTSTEVAQLTKQLLGIGLILNIDQPQGAPVAPQLERASTSVGEELDSGVPIRAEHMLHFVRAYVSARFMLRWMSLEGIAHQVRNEQARCIQASNGQLLQRTIELVGVFRQLRAYFFTARGQCLLHALMLTRFLSLYSIPVTWIIGVSMDPWRAHSWVQSGHLVLDSTPEKVFEFTPILVV